MTTERSARPMAAVRPTAAARRRAREQEILAATRELLDAGGVRDAQIEEVAQAVGINRAIIYRHFTGKEELLALTLVGYLDELAGELDTAGSGEESAMTRLTAMTEAFVDFGLRYPAFVDCAQALMRRTAPELLEEISESAMLRLGRAMTACLNQIGQVLEDGMTAGEFRTVDSVLLANHMYASGLGALQLARLGMLVKESESGNPVMTPVSAEQVKKYLVTTARALAAD